MAGRRKTLVRDALVVVAAGRMTAAPPRLVSEGEADIVCAVQPKGSVIRFSPLGGCRLSLPVAPYASTAVQRGVHDADEVVEGTQKETVKAPSRGGRGGWMCQVKADIVGRWGRGRRHASRCWSRPSI
ncbi:hypothetical protein LZ30DRAFT_462018 [Colletotrichum cereale]|nr:hypothetical protein LZ30DRAFT_462018 [Colletotrichum cereale]